MAKRFLAGVLVFCIAVSICGCGEKGITEHISDFKEQITEITGDNSENANHNLDFSVKEKEIVSSFIKEDASGNVTLSGSEADKLKEYLKNFEIEFPYRELFETEECYNRLNTEIKVEKHKFSALDKSGKLDANNLLSIVKKNNSDYLSDSPFGLEAPEDDYTLSVCKLIVDTVSAIKEQISDIDYERVYCNLGNLKILYKKGMVDNAQVSADMVMKISPNMLKIVDNMKGEHGSRDVIIHEIMHIVQIGCSCEEIKNCSRRCGISYYCSDTEFNTSDFPWLFEGSAEQIKCNLTGTKPVTYQYKINYICSLNLATLLKENIPANYLETLSFYDEAEKLYKLFDCETKEDIHEILNMMIATNIVDNKPEAFLNLYASKTGKDVKNDETITELCNTLEPYVCLVYAKHFYKNLATALTKNQITLNDLCYLIALFEASVEDHIRYKKTERKKYNDVFIKENEIIKGKLFEGIKKSCGTDAKTYYDSYSVFSDYEKRIVNASMKWNEEDKNLFCLERTDYLEFNLYKRLG